MELNGVAALVTGGASGLGAATGAALAAAGAKVTLFDLDIERGETQARAIGGRFIALDVTNEAAVAAAVEAAEAAHGVARILVNCAGIAPGSRVVGRDGAPHGLALFRKVVEVNLIGTFCVSCRLRRPAIPGRTDRGGARRCREHCVGRRLGWAGRPGRLRRLQGCGRRAYSAGCARPSATCHPRRDHRARFVSDADAGRAARGGTGLARHAGAVSKSARPPRTSSPAWSSPSPRTQCSTAKRSAWMALFGWRRAKMVLVF